MMGMERISRGKGFRGALNYAFDNKKEKGKLIGGNMSGRNERELSTEFSQFIKLRKDIEKPVWHEALRLPEGDKLDNEKWSELADDFMTRLGFNQGHPRVYILHDDKEGQHIHIIASRIDLDSKIYFGQNENLKATKVIRQLELDYNLQVFTPDPNAPKKTRKRPKKAEVEMAIRTNKLPAKVRLQNMIDLIFEHNGVISAPDFAQALSDIGAGVRANVANTGRMNGFSFELDGIAFTGTKLGASYAYDGLLSRGLIYEKDRHYEQLARWRNSGESKENSKSARIDERNSRSTRSDSREVERVIDVAEQIDREISNITETNTGTGTEAAAADMESTGNRSSKTISNAVAAVLDAQISNLAGASSAHRDERSSSSQSNKREPDRPGAAEQDEALRTERLARISSKDGGVVDIAYKKEVRKIIELAEKSGKTKEEINWQKVDYFVAKELLKAGYRQDLIEKAIVALSPAPVPNANYAANVVQMAANSKEVIKYLAERDLDNLAPD